MTWVFFSIFGAIFQAIEMAVKKKALQKKGMNNFIAAVAYTFAGFLLFVAYFIKNNIFWFSGELSLSFWISIFFTVSLNVIAVIFMYKALDLADLSYLMPFMTLTSLSLVIPPMFLLKEFPTMIGLLGITLVVAGAILMEYGKNKKTADDLKRNKNNKKGLAFFLITGICFTFTPTAMKISVAESDALFASFIVHLALGISFIFLILLSLLLKKSSHSFKNIFYNSDRSFILTILLSGLAIAIQNGSINYALSLTSVANVMSIKRTMPLFAFLIGFFYFKERTDLKKKIIATILMVVGAIFVTLQ